MLSRTAENLFWMARVMERAENTARMLDVSFRMALLPSTIDKQALHFEPILAIAPGDGRFHELFGELTAFVDGITPLYKNVSRDEVRFLLLQGNDRIMPEMNPKLADYGARVLGKRRGADIRTNTVVRAIEPGKVAT